MKNNYCNNLLITGVCLIIILLSGSRISYAQDSTQAASVKKPVITFHNSADTARVQSVRAGDSLQASAAGQTEKPKVIFTKSLQLDEKKIELISTDYFNFGGEKRSVGDDGAGLKRAMGINSEAADLVDRAYSKRTTGAVLMGIGGAIAVVGLVLQSSHVQLSSSSGNNTATVYWMPGVTIGTIVGAIGYIQYSSLRRNLYEAVDFYNVNSK